MAPPAIMSEPGSSSVGRPYAAIIACAYSSRGPLAKCASYRAGIEGRRCGVWCEETSANAQPPGWSAIKKLDVCQIIHCSYFSWWKSTTAPKGSLTAAPADYLRPFVFRLLTGRKINLPGAGRSNGQPRPQSRSSLASLQQQVRRCRISRKRKNTFPTQTAQGL
jgi:hypothetical protein